ncbi:MAG TPA: Fic family protein [Anaerolineales bacterium]
MDVSKFTKNKTGKLVSITGVSGLDHAFIPDPLPPNWAWPTRLWPLLLDARTSLAKLDGIGKHLPNPHLLLRPLQNRESLRSSRLEGTYTTPKQQLLFQIDPQYRSSETASANGDREVYNYGRALRLYAENQHELPLSLRLIRDLHRVLMEGVRGADRRPGGFRKTQNQIGHPARFVPPSPDYLPDCLDNLEKYLYQESVYDPLVKAFVVHYQFEAIHPFQDGNGRVGRLLLAIVIQEWCQLSDPWLYMSAFFDANRDEYIDRLFRVSTEGDWDGWIEFCLNGVVLQARDTEDRCERLLDLEREFKDRVPPVRGRHRINMIVEDLFITPVVQIPPIAERLGVRYQTAQSDIENLVSIGILEEMQGTSQKTYFSPKILNITYDDLDYHFSI